MRTERREGEEVAPTHLLPWLVGWSSPALEEGEGQLSRRPGLVLAVGGVSAGGRGCLPGTPSAAAEIRKRRTILKPAHWRAWVLVLSCTRLGVPGQALVSDDEAGTVLPRPWGRKEGLGEPPGMLPTRFYLVEEMLQDLASWRKALMPAKVSRPSLDVEKMPSFKGKFSP